MIQSLPASEDRLLEIKQHQEADGVCQQIRKFCRSGWPDKQSLSPDVKPYFPVAAELSVESGLILRGGRIVIPLPLRKALLDKIHSGHQGITKCRETDSLSGGWESLSS